MNCKLPMLNQNRIEASEDGLVRSVVAEQEGGLLSACALGEKMFVEAPIESLVNTQAYDTHQKPSKRRCAKLSTKVLKLQPPIALVVGAAHWPSMVQEKQAQSPSNGGLLLAGRCQVGVLPSNRTPAGT